MILFLVAGFALGVWLTGRGYEKYVIAPVRYEKASLAAMRVQILSLLRLGETDEAIKTMEMMLDNETLVLTQISNDPGQLPEPVVRALKQIKTYRAMYPAQGQQAAAIATALEKIPEVTDIKKDCQAGLCRLIESREVKTEPVADSK